MSQWNRQHWICQEMQHIWGEHELSSESIDSLPKKNGNVSRIRPLIHTKSCSALNLTGNAKDLSEVSIEFGLQIKSGKCEMESIWVEHEVLSQSINSIKCWIASSLYRLIPKLKNFQKSFKWPLCTEANLKWSFNLNYLTFTPKLIVAPKYVNLCPF